uniref:t-SNARE coiled-coil homology domain-containing protein n=1 Tax=Rhizochromulina marina TaxID=1034831 RepID=A0A7S2W424_9STRA|mmetsp:Transcript_13651/g.39786  ORF Transcript_13651/g.39786 Transcript_13651/m.39786 type:complete len:134 (+) Transcript_13651:314-715(+)
MNDKYLDKTQAIQSDTKASLNRTLNVLDDTEDVAQNTLGELGRQRDQISQIQGDVENVRDALRRADVLLRMFRKRMMSDKLFQMLAVLNLLFLVGVIVFAIYKNGGLGADKSSNKGSPGDDDATATAEPGGQR